MARDLLDRHRPAAGASAAVGRRKGLVQIEVHDVDAEIAGTGDADERVHVGAIHVDQRTFAVDDLSGFDDVFFKDAERVGVGHHERGDIVCRRLA